MASDAFVNVEPSSTKILASLTAKQKAEWRMSGELPEISKTPKPQEKTNADSSSDAKMEVAADVIPPGDGEKPPEDSAAPVTAEKKSPGPIKPRGAEARIKELLADNKRLESELDELRKRPIAAPAKIEEVAKPRRSEVDPKTGQALYATDEAFEEALDKYLSTKIKAESRREFEESQRQARIAEQNRITEKRWQNSLKIATEQHPDFAEVLDIGDEGDRKGVFRNKDLKSIKTNGVLDAWILDSEYGAVMLYHLAKNPSEIERIQSLSPFHAARELTKLEDKLASGSVTTPKESPKESSSSPTETRRVSSAPAPAASVSGRATAPVDEVEAAVKSEDFGRYARAANAEEAARRKKS